LSINSKNFSLEKVQNKVQKCHHPQLSSCTWCMYSNPFVKPMETSFHFLGFGPFANF
jgi:hypothetical protein